MSDKSLPERIAEWENSHHKSILGTMPESLARDLIAAYKAALIALESARGRQSA